MVLVIASRVLALSLQAHAVEVGRQLVVGDPKRVETLARKRVPVLKSGELRRGAFVQGEEIEDEAQVIRSQPDSRNRAACTQPPVRCHA